VRPGAANRDVLACRVPIGFEAPAGIGQPEV
jgi:hypothetical protein